MFERATEKVTAGQAGRRQSRRAVWLTLASATLMFTLAARLRGHLPGDVAIARAVQRFQPPALGGLYHVDNVLGTGLPPLLLAAAVAVALLVARRPALLAFWLVVNALLPLDAVLKALVGRPRPAAPLVRVSEHAAGLGFPSGHVFTATLLCGALVVLAEKLPLARPARRGVQIVSLACALLMAPARVYVGAHWPSDTLGGYLWGLLVLTLVLSGFRAVRPRAAGWR